jgi:hypothetical protein
MNNASSADEKSGVLYVAFGWPYLLLALESMRSVRASCPGLPIATVSSPDLIASLPDDLLKLSDSWEAVDVTADENRQVKTAADLHSPFDRTVMLDADTLVVKDLRSMFDWLDHFDIGFKLNDARLGSAGNAEKGNAPVLGGRWRVDDLPHWNGAVCLFRSTPATRAFFELWRRRFNEIGSRFDQVSLVDALFLSSTRVLSFDYRWNSPMKSYRNARKGSDVVIVHYGSDIPDAVLASARRDAARIDSDESPATAELEAFLATRAAARSEKNARLGKASGAQQTGPLRRLALALGRRVSLRSD